MTRTTRTISLVLISSALVFVGWGCPLAHEHDPAHHAGGSSGYHHYRAGHTWFWFSSYGGPVAGTGRSGGPATGNPGGTSSRGGFGSSAGQSGVSGVS